MRREFNLPEVDERLREWADYFRDRASYSKLGSAESRYKRFSGDPDTEEWGDPALALKAPKQRDWILRAIETNDALVKLPKVNRWAITYAFAYPGLPRAIMLRCLRKFSGHRLSWAQFLEQVDIGRMRLHMLLRAI